MMLGCCSARAAPAASVGRSVFLQNLKLMTEN
jgi:hypothetical protein